MRVFLVCLVLAAPFATSAGVLESSPNNNNNNIGTIIHTIQNFFTFLCTRCQEVIVLVDDAIDNQSLKKDANKLCEASLGFNEIVQKVCKSLVEDVLGEIYTQLKRIEPNRAICSHLHICDSCGVAEHPTHPPNAVFTNDRPSSKTTCEDSKR